MLPLATCGLFLALVPQSDPRCPTATIVAGDAAAGDEYGLAMIFSGDTLVLGAPRDDDLGVNSGSVYFHQRNDPGTPGDPTDDDWIELAKLHASDGAAGDLFGKGLALAGDTLFVGASRHHTPSPGGSVYAFQRDDNGTPGDALDDVWIEIDRLAASAPVLANGIDYFGQSIALSGNTVLVGALFDSQAAHQAGAAYIFERVDNGTPGDPFDDHWVEIVKLLGPAGTSGYFGNQVAFQGNTAFVAAYTATPSGSAGCQASRSGSVHVYERDDNGTPGDPLDDLWFGIDEVTAQDCTASSQFGHALLVRGDELVVGASEASVSGRTGEPGAVYFFSRDDQGTPANRFDDTWVQYAKVTGSDSADGDRFGGDTISVNDDLALFPARRDDDRGSRSGCAFVFQRDDRGTPEVLDDVWTEVHKLAPITGETGHAFGWGTLQAHEAVITSPHSYASNPGGGAAYHYDFDRACDAFAAPRLGSGATPACLTSNEPGMGTTWDVQVDNTVHPAPFLTVLFSHGRPLSPGAPMFGSELLIDLASPLHLRAFTLSSVTGTDLFRFLVPNNEPSLVGFHTFTQAAVLGTGEAHLCNALNVVLGY